MTTSKGTDVFMAGKHCEATGCNRLDFLPVRCDGCSKTFCNEHFRYEVHHCTSGRKADNQVPVCPLCNTPVPVKKGEVPDVRVNQHILADCTSDTALTKRKVYENKCAFKGCGKKEMLKLDCVKCHQNFCLAHRFPDDHNCKPSSVSRAGSAALARIARSADVSSSFSQKPALRNVPGQMENDEAFARALQQSLNLERGDVSSSSSAHTTALASPLSLQELEDLELARAIAASEAETTSSRGNQNSNSGCAVA